MNHRASGLIPAREESLSPEIMNSRERKEKQLIPCVAKTQYGRAFKKQIKQSAERSQDDEDAGEEEEGEEERSRRERRIQGVGSE